MTTDQTMTGAEAIIRSLEELGVKEVFGMPGGAILPTYDPLMDSSIRHILIRHEQGAGHAAEGFAITSGRVGCAIVTSGPAAMNVMTALADANLDSVPIVIITGQVGSALIGTDAFQEADVVGASMPISKHSFLVTNPQDIPSRIAEAFHIASTGRPGPVLVDITKDAQAAQMQFSWPPAFDIPGYRVPGKPSQKQIRAAAAAINDSNAPVLYVGGGVIRSGASADLMELVNLTDAPVVTTLPARGAIPDSDPHNLGMPGMHGTVAAVGALQRADLVIALGARFDDRVTGRLDTFAPRAKVIHVDIDAAEIGKNREADVPIVGDLKAVIEALNETLPSALSPTYKEDLSGWWRYLDRLRDSYPLGWIDTADGLMAPQYVLERLSELSGPDAIYATGVGQHQMWAAQYFDFTEPRRWLTSGSMGTMGFGLPAAIGAQFARRDMIVIDIDGDASIRMNLGELETVTTYNLPVKVVVLNNCGDGMVRQWQKLFFKGRFSATDKSLHKKDFIKAAQADGFPWARRLENPQDVAAVVAEFIAFDGPAFLEVMIDPDAGVYPMVGPGMSYAQMITGDHIRSREAPPAREAGPSEMF